MRDALAGVFLTPAGLAALGALVPLVLVYLLKPAPDRLALPTVRFLLEERGRARRLPGLRRLRRSLLLVLQALVVVLLATSLASPYVTVDERRTVEETVLVVDASASMATESGGGTRFGAATAAARAEVTGTTSVVAAGATPRVVLRRGPPAEARQALDALSVVDVAGDLRGAVQQATAVAGEDARIVVASDFAGESDWETAVRVARARGYDVDLLQFDDGGRDNVGVVDVAFDDGRVTATVRNFGASRATRTLSLGDRSTEVTLGAGDTVRRTLPVPAGGGTLRLTPGDGFPTDDAVPVAAPGSPTVRVLVLTNGGDRRLRTALSVIDAVDLTVKHPPAAVSGRYDVVVFGAVTPSRVLSGSVEVARETLRRGGGVVVTARRNVSAANYGDLLPVEPDGVRENATLAEPAETGLTRGIAFPAPERYLGGDLARGEALVSTVDGTPVLARATVDGGSVLYNGYLADASSFEYNYMFPVFWKRAVFALSGRPSLDALNHRTGERLAVGPNATVVGPGGPREGRDVALARVGFYEAGERRHAAALLDPAESAVRPAAVDGGDGPASTRTEDGTAPLDLAPLAVAAAAVVALLELGYLKRRGDV